MADPRKDELAEAKRIAERMMPPDPRKAQPAKKTKASQDKKKGPDKSRAPR